jgi:hypothetical protein
MGSLPKLKKKIALNYRKGGRDKNQNCGACAHFVGCYPVFEEFETQSRCKLIGLDQSIRYRVRLDHTCDKHQQRIMP